MASIAILTEFYRKDKVPTVKGAYNAAVNVEASHFCAPGDDSPPLVTDLAAYIDAGGTGSFSSIGYIDAKNIGEAQPGEKRIYARDTGGDIVNALYLKGDGEISIVNEKATVEILPDGTVEVSNENGSFKIFENGDILANKVTIDVDGNITTNGTITASKVVADSMVVMGKELANHTHNFVNADGVPSVTQVNN